MAGSATECAGPLQRQREVIELSLPIHSHKHRVRTHYTNNHYSQLDREMEEKRLSRERQSHYAHTHSPPISVTSCSGFPDDKFFYSLFFSIFRFFTNI